MTRPFPSLACCMGAADAFLHSSSPTNQQALVSFLHDLFSRFDELAGRYGVSKIETVVRRLKLPLSFPLSLSVGATQCAPMLGAMRRWCVNRNPAWRLRTETRGAWAKRPSITSEPAAPASPLLRTFLFDNGFCLLLSAHPRATRSSPPRAASRTSRRRTKRTRWCGVPAGSMGAQSPSCGLKRALLKLGHYIGTPQLSTKSAGAGCLGAPAGPLRASAWRGVHVGQRGLGP